MTLENAVLYLVHLVIILVVSRQGYRILDNTFIAPFYYPALFFKLGCGVLLGCLYIWFYPGGDTLNYFDAALSATQKSWPEFLSWTMTSPNYNEPQRAILFTKIVSWTTYLLRTDYWLTSIYFSLWSFFGTIYLVQQIDLSFPKTTFPSILAFLFFPSVVFWSSGVLKESLAFGSLCFLVAVYLRWRYVRKRRWMDMIIFGVSGIVLLSLKYYVFAAVILTLLCLLVIDLLKKRKKNVPWYQWVFGAVTLALISIKLLAFIHPNLEVNRIFWAINQGRETIIELTDSNSLIMFLDTNHNSFYAILNVFIAFFSGTLRPFLFENWSFPMLLACIENLLFLVLLCSRFNGSFKNWNAYRLEAMIVFGFVFVLSSLLAYSVPNFGTMARLKVYYMPCLLTLILIGHPWLESNRLKKGISLLRR